MSITNDLYAIYNKLSENFVRMVMQKLIQAVEFISILMPQNMMQDHLEI